MDEKIEQIKSAVRELLQLFVQRGQPLSRELKLELAKVLQHAENRIAESRQAPPSGEPPVQQPTQGREDLLWILAGGQEDAFVNYLRTFPVPQLRRMLKNPAQLAQTIERLQKDMPQGQQTSQGGIPHADLNSSNIYGFQYDAKTGKLLVRFQNGGVYGYDNVPRGVFKVFQHGAVPAKTKGQNQYGTWWQGKIPSLGAAFYELIRSGGYPYQKLSG
jgi:hypothetical protein